MTSTTLTHSHHRLALALSFTLVALLGANLPARAAAQSSRGVAAGSHRAAQHSSHRVRQRTARRRSDEAEGTGGSPGAEVSATPLGRAPSTRAPGQLTQVRRGHWRSRHGLEVDRDALRSTLEHTTDSPNVSESRPAHGVFRGGRRGALGSVDEAWSQVQAGGSNVVSSQGRRGHTIHHVQLDREVGYVQRHGGTRTPTRGVRVIVDGQRLVSAYPSGAPGEGRPRRQVRDESRRPRSAEPSAENGATERTERTERAPRNRQRGRRHADDRGADTQANSGGDEAGNTNAGRGGQRALVRLNVPRRPYARNVRSAQEVAADLRNSGLRNRIDESALHVRLGMPTPASTNNRNDYLIARRGYVASYNEGRRIPNWSAWTVTRADVIPNGDRIRADNFRPDAELPSDMQGPTPADYKRSGYTRGHMVASGERQTDRGTNSETFLMTNMIPQTANNNAGPWNHLENYYRSLASEGMEVHIFAGGAFTGENVRTIGRGVAVPDTTWKVIVALRPGQRIDDIDANTRVIAVNMPNTDSINPRESFERYRVSVGEIERLTGFQFFTNVPEPVANALRERVDTVSVPSPNETNRR